MNDTLDRIADRTMLRQFNKLHIAVVGGGPGGYAAAFLAADLGMQVTLIDPEAESRRRVFVSRLHSFEGVAARCQVDGRIAASQELGNRICRAED